MYDTLSELPPGDYEFDDQGELKRTYAPSPTLERAEREYTRALSDFLARGDDINVPDDLPFLKRIQRAQEEVDDIRNDLDALEDLEFEEDDEEIK